MKLSRLFALFFSLACSLTAQKNSEGTVTGRVVDRATSRPVEYVAVVVKNKTGGTAVSSGATDAKGSFSLGNIPPGSYDFNYGLVGAEKPETTSFTIDGTHRTVDLGQLTLGSE